jgi:hypothetical protein
VAPIDKVVVKVPRRGAKPPRRGMRAFRLTPDLHIPCSCHLATNDGGYANRRGAVTMVPPVRFDIREAGSTTTEKQSCSRQWRLRPSWRDRQL